MEINAAGASRAGVYSGPVTLNVGGAELEGRFEDTVTVKAEGREGWLRRRDTSRVEVSGTLLAGGSICAHEVVFEDGASLGAALRVEADSRPDLPAGIDTSLVEYVERRDERCD